MEVPTGVSRAGESGGFVAMAKHITDIKSVCMKKLIGFKFSNSADLSE